MRILLLNHEFPPLGGGGGQAAQEIAMELARRGHEITVLTSHMKGLPRQQVTEGIRILRLPSLRRHAYRAGFLCMAAYILTAVWAGLPIIRRWRSEVIHVHFAVPAGAAAWCLSHLSGVPYLLTAHLGDIPGGVPEKTSRWFGWVFPFTIPIWRRASRIITVSEFSAALVRKSYSLDPLVIPNGIDLRALPEREYQVHHPPGVIFAGRFVPQKNLLALVEALAQLTDLPWACTLLGDGPEHDAVKQAIASHHMEKRFALPGWVTNETVLSVMAENDVLCMPSLSEGLSVAGVEALAMGLAILTTRVGGSADLVEPGLNGYIMDPGDTRAIANALRHLLSDPEVLKKARLASRERASRFDIRNVVDEYEKILRGIVADAD
jgi:L-malate glycosyltransferase